MIKKGLLLVLLFCFTFCFSQKKIRPVVTSDTTVLKVTELTFTVDTAEDLKLINWKDIKTIFEKNKNNEKIEMTFRVNAQDVINTTNGFVTIGGETKNIDELLKLAKKFVKGLVRIINKN